MLRGTHKVLNNINKFRLLKANLHDQVVEEEWTFGPEDASN
jgi:hypothetical protein